MNSDVRYCTTTEYIIANAPSPPVCLEPAVIVYHRRFQMDPAVMLTYHRRFVIRPGGDALGDVFSTYFNFSLPLFHSSPFSSPLPQRTPPLSLHSFSSLSFPISSPLPSSPFSPQWRGDPRAASRPPRELDRGLAWELGVGHPRVGARPRPSRELDCGQRRSSAWPRPRRPAHGPFPADPSPSLSAPFPC